MAGRIRAARGCFEDEHRSRGRLTTDTGRLGCLGIDSVWRGGESGGCMKPKDGTGPADVTPEPTAPLPDDGRAALLGPLTTPREVRPCDLHPECSRVEDHPGNCMRGDMTVILRTRPSTASNAVTPIAALRAMRPRCDRRGRAYDGQEWPCDRDPDHEGSCHVATAWTLGGDPLLSLAGFISPLDPRGESPNGFMAPINARLDDLMRRVAALELGERPEREMYEARTRDAVAFGTVRAETYKDLTEISGDITAVQNQLLEALGEPCACSQCKVSRDVATSLGDIAALVNAAARRVRP